eukprot:GHVL01023741.1.p1 GENE.GHVL01023741.1~~GHVL01023741.1.p1  ORF type:complete len:513 (+),score=78.74 GHVL01023741.1:169-1707(+)
MDEVDACDSSELPAITDEDLSICERVLNSFLRYPSTISSPRFRGLRKILVPYTVEKMLGKRLPNMQDLTVAQRRKESNRLKRVRKHVRVEEDRKLSEKTALRCARMENLKIIQNQGSESHTNMVIPDGAAAPLLGAVKMVESSSCEDDKITERVLNNHRMCYVCKQAFDQLHFFYDKLCPKCAEVNWVKRNQTADLSGCVALVTGGRVKIGYQIVLKLLRAGCHVIVTTRFPRDACLRYFQTEDSNEWIDRLEIYGLELRHLGHVKRFCDFLKTKFQRLDIIINNACQTVRRPAAYYSHMIPLESIAQSRLPEHLLSMVKSQNSFNEYLRSSTKQIIDTSTKPLQLTECENIDDAFDGSSANLSQIAVMADDVNFGTGQSSDCVLPEGIFDVNGQQLDCRKINSWVLKLHEIEVPELVEVFSINSCAPFILASQLKPLLLRHRDSNCDEDPNMIVHKYIVNVSAMEGKFYRHKLPTHPHTNMAKAALNMLTRTSAQDYAKDNIWMNSVVSNK